MHNNTNLQSSILVIGGGAAGVLAAITASRTAGKQGGRCAVMLLERNTQIGAKISISGGGKCNVTHSGAPDELLERGFLRKNEQRFLRSALYNFSNTDLLDLLQHQGVPGEERPDGKVFPVSGSSLSVVRAFGQLLKESSVQIHFSCRVKSVRKQGNEFHVRTDEETFTANAVIIATGGVSYSRTGTTGDGISIARKFGHTIIEPAPALAPVYTVKPFPAELSGLSFRNVSFIASSGKRTVSRRGDVLFTHRGFSGPAVLSLSRDIAELSTETTEVFLFADFFPEQTAAELEKFLLEQAKKNGSQTVRKFLQTSPIAPPAGSISSATTGTIPTAIVPYIMRNAGLDSDVSWAGLSREKRQSLLGVLKRFPLGKVRDVPLEQGEISSGGVSLAEVNPKTMQSRIVPGLFLCGELLDYAGEIGGFNLQAAFSTGWTAGHNAAKLTYPAQE